MKSGYIVEFKRKGFTATLLGGLLKLFEPSWDGWGWHLAIAWERAYQGWLLLEATASGVMLNFYEDKFLEQNTRSWKWLDKTPTRAEKDKFFEEHTLKRYDIAIYFWTSLAIITRHYFNRPIPKLFDDRWSCHELIQDYAEVMGKPIVSRYDVVIITDIIKALKEKTDATNK